MPIAILISLFICTSLFGFQLSNAWTPAQKLGQSLCIGLDVRQPEATNLNLIRTIQPGCVMLYGNPFLPEPDIRPYIDRLQAASDIPLWVAVDQEGGRVSRLRETDIHHASAKEIAANLSVKKTEALGRSVGKKLGQLGFNLNFAPVLDLALLPNNTVIGDRSFGQSPKTVSAYGQAYITGLQSTGVLATAKHFPGHGNTTIDSHFQLAFNVSVTQAEIDRDLTPFKQAIAAEVQAIMIGHLLSTTLDPSQVAVYSEATIKQLLKQALGFKGIVITDDLSMVSAGEQAIDVKVWRALSAGNHLALVVASPIDLLAMHESLSDQLHNYSSLVDLRFLENISFKFQIKND